MLAWLSQAVAAMSGGDRLSYALIGLIIDRIRCIKQRVARLAARIRDGRYQFRIVTAPRSGTPGPRPPDPLPKKFGWLLKLVPEAVQYRGQLENLFRDAEMAALLAAAPASLGRPVRSLCHMLGLRPPEILAPPAKPRPPRQKTPPPEAPPPPPPRRPPPDAPEWLRTMPGGKPWPLSRFRFSRDRA
jgi:hypothetical protein